MLQDREIQRANPTLSVNNESFNALLSRWQLEDRVYTYINNLKYLKDSFKDIKFGLIEEGTKEYNTHLGYAHWKDGIQYIKLHPKKLTDEQASFTICHEIGHVEHKLNGYRTIVRPSMNETDKDYEYWLGLCSTLLSTLSDYLINKQLKKDYHFSLTFYKQTTIYDGILDTIKNLQGKKVYLSYRIWFSLKICAAKLSDLNKSKLEVLRQYYQDLGILDEYKAGEEAYQKVVRSLDTPETYKQSIEKLLTLYKITNYIHTDQSSQFLMDHTE